MVVLATKLYVEGSARERSVDSLTSLVGNALGDLDVEHTVGVRDDGFPSITVDGPDETAARNLLREEWGEVTDQFEAGATYVGTLESWGDGGLVLDAGREVRVPPDEIGLGVGSPAQVRERFGLVQHVPLWFEWGDPPSLAADEQDRLYDWRRGDGRVNVNSATRAEVRATVNRAGHAQDIVTVERLGLLEQSIVCEEGTDPPGLVAAIGEYLPAELLAVVP
jgi:hypothetical protein